MVNLRLVVLNKCYTSAQELSAENFGGSHLRLVQATQFIEFSSTTVKLNTVVTLTKPCNATLHMGLAVNVNTTISYVKYVSTCSPFPIRRSVTSELAYPATLASVSPLELPFHLEATAYQI